MTAYEKFYRERLYPFQDGILAIVRRIDVPFYLTGGTALSRHYSPVRYSDDLDLFVNRAPEFSPWVERFYAALEHESSRGLFSILTDRVLRFEDYVQIFLQQPAEDEAVTLKLDLVNDVAPRYGDLEWDDALGRVDSWRNILSNIKWVEPKPDETLFMADLQVMAAELFEGLDNTLAVDR
jgi:hypothetical protein